MSPLPRRKRHGSPVRAQIVFLKLHLLQNLIETWLQDDDGECIWNVDIKGGIMLTRGAIRGGRESSAVGTARALDRAKSADPEKASQRTGDSRPRDGKSRSREIVLILLVVGGQVDIQLAQFGLVGQLFLLLFTESSF